MKSSLLKQFIKNSILYLALAFALYFLYSPLNKDVANQTRSAVQFVYQQF